MSAHLLCSHLKHMKCWLIRCVLDITMDTANILKQSTFEKYYITYSVHIPQTESLILIPMLL